MANGTCSQCDNPVRARGMCQAHYDRWRNANPDDVSVQRPKPHPCKACGVVITETRAWYCSAECKPRCEVAGCERPCRGPRWCDVHRVQVQQSGEAKPILKPWAELGGGCVVCGKPVKPGHGRRKHCSDACQQVDSYHRRNPDGRKRGRPRVTEPKARPESFVCRLCGKTVTTKQRTEGGRLQRTDIIWCRECGRDSIEARRFKKYGVTPEQFAEMTANGCAICGAKDRRYHVDHDHACCPGDKRSCGKCVRGVLCGQCNQALGMLQDREDLLLKAIHYLRG